jgi:hypothetical protein
VVADQGDRLGHEALQSAEHRAKRNGTSLKRAWCADTEEQPHPEAEIERAGVQEQRLR